MNSFLGQLKVLTGNANRQLAKDVCKHLGAELIDSEVTHFSDGEIAVNIKETVRGADVFIVQPTHEPVNDNLMELLIMIEMCIRDRYLSNLLKMLEQRYKHS